MLLMGRMRTRNSFAAAEGRDDGDRMVFFDLGGYFGSHHPRHAAAMLQQNDNALQACDNVAAPPHALFMAQPSRLEGNVRSRAREIYRDRQILLNKTQAEPGRKVKQDQEEISRNRVRRFLVGV